MGYWDATDNYLEAHGGRGPPCPYCGEDMFPQDDHGRFACFCEGYRRVNRPLRNPIPQVTDENLSDEEKEKIPPINRLNLPLTKSEKKFLDGLLEDMRKPFQDSEPTN